MAADPEYPPRFQAVFGTGVTPLAVTQALASFVRGLVSGDNRLDRHRRGEPHALSAAEKRGLAIFEGERGECFHCHTGFNLTNDRFANNGTFQPGGDVGRQRITQKANDLGRFRVPSLRNVAVTAPYMHDGSLATLEQVIDHYDRGGRGHESTDANIRKLNLTAGEKRDLPAFLNALTDETFLSDPKLTLPVRQRRRDRLLPEHDGDGDDGGQDGHQAAEFVVLVVVGAAGAGVLAARGGRA